MLLLLWLNRKMLLLLLMDRYRIRGGTGSCSHRFLDARKGGQMKGGVRHMAALVAFTLPTLTFPSFFSFLLLFRGVQCRI